MRNIWTIARKELRGYFDHPTAYILLVVFLVINFFFYFRSAFLMGEASLRPLFDLLPWILLFFVPAVTMGAVAEERRHQTLEITLSHPIHEHQFLLGKYAGNLLFMVIALGVTFLVPISLLLGGKPDFGVVLAQYFGGVLLIAGMAAVGVAASALTRNQITAFIVGTAVILVLMILGTEVVQIGLPAWLAGPAAQLGILPHFENVARGVIDLRDVVYFVALTAAFLALAYWLLLRDRLSHGSHLYRNLRFGTAAIVAIAVVANLFGSYIPGRLDLTAENLYTMSPGTRSILRNVNDLVTITLFESKELPAEFKRMERDVSDVLRDFKRYSRGNVQVLRKHPDSSDQARREAERLGIRPVQFNVVRREELQLKQGWLGLAVQFADSAEVVPFVGDTRNLEYQLASNIWRLTRSETPKVAYISGHGEKTRADYGAFNRELARTYELASVDLSADTAVLQPDLDAIIVAGPKQAMGDRARSLIRRYLAGGGRMLYLAEGTDVNLQYLFASALPDSVRQFSEQLGVRVNNDLVFDLQSSERISVPGQVFNYIVDYPFWLRALPAAEHPIIQNINSVVLPWASSLDTLATLAGREFTPLLTTSPYSGRQRGNYEIRPDVDLAYDPAGLEPYLVAVAVQGAVGAGTGADQMVMAAGAPGQEAEEQATASQDTLGLEGPAAGRAVIVADSDFLTDRFSRSGQAGVIFALNAIDWLTQTEALLTIRSKTPTPRPLVFDSNFETQAVKYLNLAGLPLMFVLFGTVRLFRRRSLKRRKYGE